MASTQSRKEMSFDEMEAPPPPPTPHPPEIFLFESAKGRQMNGYGMDDMQICLAGESFL